MRKRFSICTSVCEKRTIHFVHFAHHVVILRADWALLGPDLPGPALLLNPPKVISLTHTHTKNSPPFQCVTLFKRKKDSYYIFIFFLSTHHISIYLSILCVRACVRALACVCVCVCVCVCIHNLLPFGFGFLH